MLGDCMYTQLKEQHFYYKFHIVNARTLLTKENLSTPKRNHKIGIDAFYICVEIASVLLNSS